MKKSKSLLKLQKRLNKALLYGDCGIYIKDINMNTKDVKAFLRSESYKIKNFNNERLYLNDFKENNYEIDRKFSYSLVKNKICIGSSGGRGDGLSESEFMTLVIDSLTHEHIHKAIYKISDVVTCVLFDAIEHKLRDEKIHIKGLKYAHGVYTHKQSIKRYGFNLWLRFQYGLSLNRLIKEGILIKKGE